MCKICESKSVYEFTNKRKLCKSCFIKWFQKKVLFTVRKFRMINENDTIFYKKGRDFRSVVLEDILKLIAGNRIRLSTKKGNKKAVPVTTDIVAKEIINNLINKDIESVKKSSPVDKNVIKPLFLFLDNEVRLYARLKGLKYKEEKNKQDSISVIINKLEEKHPEIKHSIINSFFD